MFCGAAVGDSRWSCMRLPGACGLRKLLPEACGILVEVSSEVLRWPSGPICSMKKGKFPIGPLGLNEGYTTSHSGPLPDHTPPGFPGPLPAGLSLSQPLTCPSQWGEGKICTCECCRWCSRDDMLLTPMESDLDTVGRPWVSLEQAGWPSPDCVAYISRRIN